MIDRVAAGWLAPGTSAAVCMSIDDVHPGRSSDPHYEAGGDLERGVLGRLERLLDRHPQLHVTAFVVPDWRERSPLPTRTRLARIPVARDLLHLTPSLPRATMRLDRHPAFCAYLREHPRIEVAVHGLSHLARGLRPPAEFERLGERACRRRVRRARGLFERARVASEPGFAPPGWELSPALARALVAENYEWVSSARDLNTAVSRDARTRGSGLTGVSLVEPHWILGGRLVHFTTNWQATSSDQRAFEVLECGGLLSIKAHAIKEAFGFIALDGLDDAYCDRLDRLLAAIEDRYGDAVWWTTMGAIARGAREPIRDAQSALPG